MFTECDEVAEPMRENAPRFTTLDQARQYVRSLMPDESCTVIDNTAESLLASQRR
jgi:hypothetical protein